MQKRKSRSTLREIFKKSGCLKRRSDSPNFLSESPKCKSLNKYKLKSSLQASLRSFNKQNPLIHIQLINSGVSKPQVTQPLSDCKSGVKISSWFLSKKDKRRKYSPTVQEAAPEQLKIELLESEIRELKKSYLELLNVVVELVQIIKTSPSKNEVAWINNYTLASKYIYFAPWRSADDAYWF